ncbi:MAG TPA: aldo/keto reductase, partial [Nitrospiraceae bacterium]|nr:aldo/keto reductase [Nitrospiraceae bacterium]
LELAKRVNKPILLSIGYSACHWCHVMERESFEDPRIAALMNEHFVCIKVDREERPELDEIYMQATIALNQGQGGWPMTVFLTPEQEPIFAGTYFPPADRWGRPGFATVLNKIADYWRTDAEGLRRQARDITERLRKEMHVAAPMSVGEMELDRAVTQFAEEFDARYGGFGRAPKFPPATGLALLLRRYDRTGEEHIAKMVRKTLDAMAAGGMYDHIGGGFARYSTDERWLVPHFEKMLYDNALLTRTYLEAYQKIGEADYRRVAAETLEYILREMTSPEGGFYSATDADSEGVEGKFFVWTPEEIRAAVPSEEDARRFCAYYDITTNGNWEHTSIPNRLRPADDVARDLGISREALEETIAKVKPLVYEARQKRVPPALDDKIITAWNGMMISAMAEGARVLGDNRYLEAGEEAADFLLRTMIRPDHGLYRTYRDGRAHLDACLEDYAFLADGLLDLYEAGAHEGYLDEAVRLADRIRADFSDRDHGGFYTTAESHEALIVRSREGPDGATPSGNAVAAMVLARLSFHYGREDFRSAATGAVRAYGKQIARYPRAFAKTLAVVDLLLNGPVELALVGTQGDVIYEALRAEVNRRYLPNRTIAHYDPQGPEPEHPLTTGKGLVNDTAALYVCRNFACQRPITDPHLVDSAVSSHAGASDPSETRHASTLEGDRIHGRATATGTGSYAGRVLGEAPHSSEISHSFTEFGSTGLTTSRLGFGCYRAGLDEADHRQALIKALRTGCNLIDTSTNYMDGDSERLVGSVLADLIKNGELQREHVIVVSKVGYVQGENLTRAQAREKTGKSYPEMVKYAEGLWHCLHPEFLADQLSVSLDRLGLQTLDVLLLHNVEYFLSEAAHRGSGDLIQVREEFYRRLHRAFEYLESQVGAGRIQWYGVSSN